MSHVSVFGIVGLVVIVLVLVLRFAMLLRARRAPSSTRSKPLPRGPVSGGVIRGDPGQKTSTREPAEPEEERRGPSDP
jgi:hypothetical protein